MESSKLGDIIISNTEWYSVNSDKAYKFIVIISGSQIQGVLCTAAYNNNYNSLFLFNYNSLFLFNYNDRIII